MRCWKSLSKILVVDDELDTVNLAKVILEREGYWVTAALNGEEALTAVQTEQPDLVLLDLVMPGKSGLEVCKILKSQPKTKNMPIIMFTALGRDVDRKLTAAVGADAHFMKPFTPPQLSVEVKRWLMQAKASKFSRQLGLDHAKLKGRKILLEIDPRADYERPVRDFTIEASFYEETVIVITQKGSAIRHVLEDDENVKFLDLDQVTSFSAILNMHSDGALSLIFDSITDFILSQQNSTESVSQMGYKFAQNALKVLNEPRITALFLLNTAAHDPHDLASLRGLFSNQASYDSQGIMIVKLGDNIPNGTNWHNHELPVSFERNHSTYQKRSQQ